MHSRRPAYGRRFLDMLVRLPRTLHGSLLSTSQHEHLLSSSSTRQCDEQRARMGQRCDPIDCERPKAEVVRQYCCVVGPTGESTGSRRPRGQPRRVASRSATALSLQRSPSSSPRRPRLGRKDRSGSKKLPEDGNAYVHFEPLADWMLNSDILDHTGARTSLNRTYCAP